MFARTLFLSALCLTGHISLGATLSTPKVFYNNRVLARVHDKNITLLDVVKAMDLFITENDPQSMSSFEKKMTFYHQAWQIFLKQQIENELVLTEAKSLKIKIPEGEVNEEVLRRFGPEVTKRLHEMNLTPDEARIIVERDLIVSRLVGSRATMKAIQQITPERVHLAYRNYLEKNPEQAKLEYSFISVRGDNEKEKEACVQKAHKLLQTQSISSVVEALKADFSDLRISASKNISAEEENISPEHRTILQSLTEQAVSDPVKQTSKSGTVYRVFHLAKRDEIKPQSLENMFDQLQNKLLQDEVAQERTKFLNKLREKYDVTEQSGAITIPSDYVPFEIR